MLETAEYKKEHAYTSEPRPILGCRSKRCTH